MPWNAKERRKRNSIGNAKRFQGNPRSRVGILVIDGLDLDAVLD